MANKDHIPFSVLLKKFTTSIQKKRAANSINLVLIIMANTHDHTLSACCIKDVKAIKNAFKIVCKNAKIGYCDIEISGSNYTRHNLWTAMEVVNYNTGQINVFYYTGHGYSYANDKNFKYPQLDFRPYSNEPHYNSIEFIEKNTDNLESILLLLRLGGGRVNIAIADCCNTTISHKRSKKSKVDVGMTKSVLPGKLTTLNEEIYEDENNDIRILISSSQQGVSAVSDASIGSLFTHYFTKILVDIVAAEKKHDEYLPWGKVLQIASRHAFKNSQQYEADGGKPGHQKAVFEVFVYSE